MDNENCEEESFMELLVDSFSDISPEDLELISNEDLELINLNPEFFYEEGKNVPPFQNDESICNNTDMKYEDSNDISLSTLPLKKKLSHVVNPSLKSIILHKKSINKNRSPEMPCTMLKKKVDESTKRLRFLARWTEVSRRQVLLFEKDILYSNKNSHACTMSNFIETTDSQNINKASKMISSKPQTSFSNIENSRRGFTCTRKRISSVSTNFGKIPTNNIATSNERTFDINNATSSSLISEIESKLRFSMNRTQISRGMFTRNILKEKSRHLELEQNQERNYVINVDQSNEKNLLISDKRKSIACLEMPTKRLRILVKKN